MIMFVVAVVRVVAVPFFPMPAVVCETPAAGLEDDDQSNQDQQAWPENRLNAHVRIKVRQQEGSANADQYYPSRVHKAVLHRDDQSYSDKEHFPGKYPGRYFNSHF